MNPGAEPQDSSPIFTRLPAGRGKLSPEDVARNQKARLQGAMVEAVARHGYADTTLRELVGLAGVSKSTFYDHFENKEQCFLSTFDEIVAELSERVTSAYQQRGDFREKLEGALGEFMRTAAEEPAAARLGAVDSLTLGAAGVEHRERASAAFEALIERSFESSPEARPMPATTVRAVVGGIRGVTYRHLREGTQDELPGLSQELVDWALGYQKADSEPVRRAMEAASQPTQVVAEQNETVPWSEPPDSKLSRSSLSQRERMIRGTAQAVVQDSYAALSIPTISATSGVSNQTFYEHFSSKRDAFLAAIEQISGRALTVTVTATAAAGDRPEAMGVAARALLEHIAADEFFAQLTFFELPTAGPMAMDRADALLDGFTELLKPSAMPTGVEGHPTTLAIYQAIASGIWATVQHEIYHGRRTELPRLAPEITRLGLAPVLN